MTDAANLAENIALKKEVLQLKTKKLLEHVANLGEACRLEIEIQKQPSLSFDDHVITRLQEQTELDKLQDLHGQCTYQFKKGAKNGTLCGKIRCRQHKPDPSPEFLKEEKAIKEKYAKIRKEKCKPLPVNKEFKEQCKNICQQLVNKTSNLLEFAKPLDATNDLDVQICVKALTETANLLEKLNKI